MPGFPAAAVVRLSVGDERVEVVEQLAEDLARRWRAGECPGVEEYLLAHPELAEQPDAALELVAEEICLRAEAGHELEAAEFVRRFPQWRRQVQALFDCHLLMAPRSGLVRFPAAGDALGDFRLLAELGRGSHGRVFLAQQADLADRPVVLKLAPSNGREHLSLSRLQHTHIVPLYSVHDFPERGLRGLCQPYFGGGSLADLLVRVNGLAARRRTGLDLLGALQAGAGAVSHRVSCGWPCLPVPDARASYVQAVCWLGACLAEALQYAARTGPLAPGPQALQRPAGGGRAADASRFPPGAPPLAAGAPPPSGLGGTPGYMAPEHRAALTAVAERHAVPAAVDGRADIYSLGMLLFGALGGGGPMPADRPAEQLRRFHPGVSVGLADLLGRCLAAEPDQRYQSAGEVAADLRRHLADLPLHGVANRSLSERWRKWRRRRPLALPFAGVVLAGVMAAGLLIVQAARQARTAEADLQQGEEHLRQRHYTEALDAFRHGAALTDDLPYDGGLRRRLRGGIDRAERGRAAWDLHLLCERMRLLYGADFLPQDQVQVVADACRELWQKRELIARRLGEPGAAGAERELQADLLDLAILWTNLRVRLAPPAEALRAHREGLEVLAEAEALFGPSCVLCRERRTHALALGQAKVAEAAAREEAALTPRGSWEYYALGRAYLQAGDLPRAAEHLDHALELQPQGLWQNFSRGICAYRMGQFQDARAAFSACVALAPQCAACFCNRGQAYAELDQLERAAQDFDAALRLEPDLAAASLARAEIRQRQPR